MKTIFLLLILASSLHALEIDEFEKKLASIKTKTRFLEMLVVLKIIDKPDWQVATPLAKFQGGDLGLESIAITPKNSNSIKCLEFIGVQRRSYLEDSNIEVLSLVVETADKVINYTFDDNLKCYKLTSETKKDK
jgi:hypothetical protein